MTIQITKKIVNYQVKDETTAEPETTTKEETKTKADIITNLALPFLC